MAGSTKGRGTKKRSSSQKKSEAIAGVESLELSTRAGDDVRYLLDQCEALVKERDSWKQRATDAERLFAELKMDKQELIRAVTTTLNQS